jgi:hypothetical protein
VAPLSSLARAKSRPLGTCCLHSGQSWAGSNTSSVSASAAWRPNGFSKSIRSISSRRSCTVLFIFSANLPEFCSLVWVQGKCAWLHLSPVRLVQRTLQASASLAYAKLGGPVYWTCLPCQRMDSSSSIVYYRSGFEFILEVIGIESRLLRKKKSRILNGGKV